MIIISIVRHPKWRAASQVVFAAILAVASTASAALVVSTDNQTGPTPFTPTWPPASNSLIAGISPSSSAGDFNKESQAGTRNVDSLTAGGTLTIESLNGTCSANYVTGGDGGGTELVYTLPASTYGYDITNITVQGGWQDNGRDQQAYTVYYSTTASPTIFTVLTAINHNQPTPGGIASATRVVLSDSEAGTIAMNVAAVRFDFSWPASENGYTGYGAITIGGFPATNGPPVPPTPEVTMNTAFPTSSSSSADAVLVFNEIMYHPETDEAGMEWIEFYNQLAVDVDISNWQVSGDIDYAFPPDTRVAGRSFIVLAHDPATLEAATGLTSNVFGPFLSPLDNQGAKLELHNNSGRLMDRVKFGTERDWPVTPDGAGPSMAKIDRDWGSGSGPNWQASWQVGGTPGLDNFVSPPSPVMVAFNEVAGTTNGSFWVELMNYGTNPVSLGNSILHHDGVTNTQYQLPPDTTLNPGDFLVLSNNTLGFVSPESSEKLFLFASNYTAVYDGYVLKKRSQARDPDGTGGLMVPNLPTPGASNSFAFRSELVINEIMYNHKDFPAGDTNSIPQRNPEEWLEIYNRSDTPVDLTGWTLSGGISYSFNAGKTITPGGYLIVAEDVTALSATYPAIDIVGNYSGRLSSDDAIILADPLGNPGDQVHYYSKGRWPDNASGGGSSLELRDPNADNSLAEAWAASEEADKSSWQTYTYQMVAQPSATSAPDGQWQDFVMGLLGGGECWVDDISVIESPDSTPVQLIANGDFENGLTGWRVVGNHQRSVVEPDPDDAGNQVLHVVSSGPQEHMNNHIETTLANGQSVDNGVLYEVSYRARWISGNSLLNTRLYFNRVARTTAVSAPQLNGTPGAVNSVHAANIGPTFVLFQHQPVVPLANQPVTVFVRAQDPQGVTQCEVWWSVNGGAWTSAPMTATNGVYVGTIPNYSANSLVQFYVSGVDGLGAVSTYPGKGPNSGAFYRVYDGAAFVEQFHNLRILMSPDNISLQYATTNLMSNENLPCTVIYDERQAYYDVKVRLKSSQRGRIVANRIGFHLEFNPDDLFRGVHPVMLMDRSAGGSRPPNEEILVKHMLEHAGIAAVSSDICRVIAPQSAQTGVALLSPRFEDRFIDSAFKNGGDGTLFEFELTYYPLSADGNGYKVPAPDSVQGVDISNLGDDKETYRYNFMIKNHRSTDDYSTFMNFAKKLSLSGTSLDTQTQTTMDVDEWLRAYAMISLCGVGDMYTFGGNHNWMMYIRPEDNRLLYFPWDMDFSFNQSTSASLVGGQNFSKVVNLPGNLRRFYAHMLDIINTTYNSTYMTYWVNHYGAKAGQDFTGDLGYITSRGNYAISAINGAGGNTPFSVSEASPITVNDNLVTLSGTAPVSVSTILINGNAYPVTWSSISSWTAQVSVGAATNLLSIEGYDLNGNLITSTTRTVVYTGPVAPPQSSVVFNETMITPAAPNAEYVELLNTSPNFAFDLSGWRINGLDYTFPSGSLLPANSLLVLARDRLEFASTYGSSLPVFGEFDGKFDLDGETLTLFMPDVVNTNQEIVVDRVRYETAVPWAAMSNGMSLQLIDAARDNSRVANWATVDTNTASTPQWIRVSATGIPQPSAGSRPLYVYLQSAGDIHIDDISVVAGSVAESGVNLVSNNGFESALSSWTVGSDGNNSASASSTDFAHSGSRSLHLIASSGGTTRNSSLWQDFSGSLTVGATYTLSFWYLPTTNGGPLTLRFSGNGINNTIDPAPGAAPSQIATPAVANSVTDTLPAFPSVWLNEVQPENVTGPTNTMGLNVPWVELYNPGTNALSLSGLYLANNYTNLTQWAFPANSSIPANGFLVVWCDGQTNQSATNTPHTSFTLASGTGSIVLARLINGNIPQIVDYLNYASLSANWTYGDYPDGQPFFRQTMFVATPQTLNTNTSPPITISINEWMADNNQTLANPVGGKFDDWFELYNYGTNTVDLGGYYLTGTLTNKTKFPIPNTQQYRVPPNGFFLVWADNSSGSNSTNQPGLHVNFKLSKLGDAIGLFAPDGTAIDALTFGTQMPDQSQGRFPDGSAEIFSMPTATPQTNNIIPNTAPVVGAISDKFVHVGQTVQFTAIATDAQSEWQTLTFSLTNSPTGASIHPTSGAFLWTITNVPAPGTNSVTVRITDDGTPPLSNAETFTVVVSGQPQFTGASPQPDKQIQISFGTLLGRTYQVQFKDSLTNVTWASLGESIVGTGLPAIISDDITGSPQRFYRLIVLP